MLILEFNKTVKYKCLLATEHCGPVVENDERL